MSVVEAPQPMGVCFGSPADPDRRGRQLDATLLGVPPLKSQDPENEYREESRGAIHEIESYQGPGL